jgi:hypothetical protein
MGSTSHAQIVRSRSAAQCSRVDVVELEHRSGCAALPAFAEEGALLAIASKYLAPYRTRDVFGLRRSGPLRPHCLAQPLLLERGDQHVECALHDSGERSVRIAMPQQLRRALELLAQLGAGGELNLVPRLRERLDPRPRTRALVRARRGRARCPRESAFDRTSGWRRWRGRSNGKRGRRDGKHECGYRDRRKLSNRGRYIALRRTHGQEQFHVSLALARRGPEEAPRGHRSDDRAATRAPRDGSHRKRSFRGCSETAARGERR